VKRLSEELDIHQRAGETARDLGWRRAAAMATAAPTARLHGLLLARELPAGERRALVAVALSRHGDLDEAKRETT